MSFSKYTELIAKQLHGATNADEDRKINEWLSQSEEHRNQYRAYEIIWSKTKINFEAKNSKIVFDKILDVINDDKQKFLNPESITRKSGRLQMVVKVAAAAIVLIFVTTMTIKFVSHGTTEAETTVSQVNRTLPKGQKLKVFLPDGSTVWLNAESSLKYPDRFDNESRIVELTGEAFFDIKRDTLKPFIVRVSQVDVTVLGTSFNVRSYPDETDTEVALEKGKVLVSLQSKDKQQVFLLPGEGLTVNNVSGEFHKKAIDPMEAYGWKDGVLYFKDAGFYDIVEKLSRWYDVKIEVQNFDKSEWAYSGEFHNEYLSNVLESISFSKEFEYQLDQNKVVIKFNPKNMTDTP